MKNLFGLLLILVIASTAGAVLYHKYGAELPCAKPVLYAVGAVDPRFSVSTSTVLQEAEAAAGIWNKAAGKTVLAYSPSAAMKVNLVYDEREQAAKLGAELATQDAELDTERERLDTLHNQLVADEAAYNQKVADVNAQGGAGRGEYAALQAEGASLSERASALNQDARAFNAAVNAFNTTAATYNQTAGHTFEEGHYVQDASGARIDIYEFVGTGQLERVLAHELGHAIGLEHNSDPASIMYAENESGQLTPSATDIADLDKLCGISS